LFLLAAKHRKDARFADQTTGLNRVPVPYWMSARERPDDSNRSAVRRLIAILVEDFPARGWEVE
jgi:hypothetical protein